MKKQTKIKILILFCVLLLFTVLLYSFREGGDHAAEEGERVEVRRGDVISRATETGSLVPINAVEIKSEQAGEVRDIFVQAGDLVAIGQPLAALRPESSQSKRVAEARATIESERLNWEEGERSRQRMSELFEKGFIARREMEEAIKQEETAKIKYELAKKQLLLTLGGNKTLYNKYLKMDLSTESMEDFVVLSPVAGTVIEINVSGGEMVSSGMSTVTGGTVLMRIADLSKMWIKTKINEVNIGQIREKQSAEIRLDAIPNQVYKGVVIKISPKGEKMDNIVSYEVTLEIVNPDRRLMPSMTANVDIITGEAKNVLYLPQIALTQLNGRDAVRILSLGGKTEYKTVEVGLKNETVAVIKKGLKEGEPVFLPKKKEKKE